MRSGRIGASGGRPGRGSGRPEPGRDPDGSRTRPPPPPTAGSVRGPSIRPTAAAAVGLLAGLVVAGCSLVGGGSGEAPGSPAPGQPTDASGSAAAGSAADTTPSPAAADSDASLRDSILAVLDSARAETDTATGGEEAAASAEREPNVAESGPSGPVYTTDVDSLKALGPVYTPYDVGPVLRKQGLEGLLRATILPAIRKHELSPDEWARFWVLVDREGRVVATVDHLTSGHGAFDDAARVVAESLRYRPAVRDDEFVPVWILARVSLLMV